MDKFETRVALITGAGSGMGRSTALALAQRGTRLLVTDIDAQGLAGTEALIAATGAAEVAAVVADVGEDQAMESLRDAMLTRFGRVDIVMNNVGVLTRGLPEHIPIEEWNRILNINLMSVVRSNIAFLPLLIAQGEGHIVNTASFAGLFTYSFDRLPYAASKAALVQISEGLAIYLKPKGIGVTCLCPGPVATNMMALLRTFGPPTVTRGPGQQFALKDPDEVGEMVVDALLQNRFMVPTHDNVWPLLAERAADWDGFLQKQVERPDIVDRA